MDEDQDLGDGLDLDDDDGLSLDYQQDGPGLFDEPLPDPEPACDIRAANGEVDESVTAPLPAAPAARFVGEASAMTRPASPLALYRRYRPDTFAEVIGQEHVTEPLSRAIANNKVHHAYLFSGPRGCGKTTSARILARCLNCAEGPTPTPCGVCDSCVALATGGPGSIDVIEIDAASHGLVDDARDLREKVFFAPVASRYKVYIIDEAHMVTKQGFNALLKVVEEPPEHVKFIFATTEPDKVIGTIKSRTHHYPFRLVPPRILTSYLERICEEEGVAVERGVLPLVVRAGAGSVRDSLSVLDQLLGAADRSGVSYAQATSLLGYTPDALLDDTVDAFAAGDGSGVFATIDKVIEVGQDPRRFAEDLLQRMRDLVIIAQVPEAIESGLIDVSEDQAERLRSQAASLGAGELTRAAEVIATGLTQMRGTTAPRLHLELICARVLLPNADQDGRGLHARLDRLERRLDMPDLLPGREPGLSTQADRRPAAPSGRGGATDEPSAQGARTQRPVTPTPQAEAPSQATPTERTLAPTPEVEPPAVRRPAAQRPAPTAVAPTTADAERPAAERPRGQRPAAARPAAQAEPTGQPSEVVSAAGPPPAAPAGPTTADLRRLWPQVLDEVKSRKRFTHALLSQNAHVVEVRGRELLLGFSSQGTLERFQSGGSVDVLRDCLIEVLGADLHIQASVDGGPLQQSRQPPAVELPAQRPPAAAAVQRAPAPANHRRPPQQPERTLDVPPPPEPDDWVGEDDEILDETGVDAAELLARQLGAQIIDEEEL